MDPIGFQNALGECPDNMAGVKALASIWNRKISLMVVTITPCSSLSSCQTHVRVMKWKEWQSVSHWKKMRCKSNQTLVRSHFRDYTVSIAAEKKCFPQSLHQFGHSGAFSESKEPTTSWPKGCGNRPFQLCVTCGHSLLPQGSDEYSLLISVWRW